MQQAILKYTILLFGISKEIVGSGAIDISLPPKSTVHELLKTLQSEYPELARLKSLVVAVNGEYADKDQMIVDSDEIALIPPVSGG